MGFYTAAQHYMEDVSPPSAFTSWKSSTPEHTYVCRHVTSNGNNMSGCVVLFMTAKDEQEFDHFPTHPKQDEDRHEEVPLLSTTHWIGV